MNLPNFKDILRIVLEKLSLFKNNLSLLIPVIIVFISILVFVPTQLLSSSLKKQVQKESITPGANVIRNLTGKTVSQKQLEAEKQSIETFAADVNDIEKLAIQTTQRELLSNDVFGLDPNDPNKTFSQSIFYEFGRRYCGKIDDFIEEHNAGSRPSDDELQEQVDAASIDEIMQTGTMGMSNFDYSMNEQGEIEGVILDEICQQKAQSTFIYMDTYQISGYEFWELYSYNSWEEDVENCWYSQLGYWMIEDIFDTILAMNEGYESLVDAPVKRLMDIQFSDGMTTTVSKNKDKKTQVYSDRPSYVCIWDDYPKETLTGRYTDEEYDVMHFNVTLVVSTKDFLPFIKELCSEKEHQYIDESGQSHTYKHNQISVLDYSLRSVDEFSEDHLYYKYGNENVSEVELTCEYLFNNKGYRDVIPQSVYNMLNDL